MHFKNWFTLLSLNLLLALTCSAEPTKPLNLKSFVGPSRFNTIGAEWLIPLGPQVLDGTPFQVDGIVFMFGDNASQRANPGRTNVNNIPVGQRFETLHLLAASHSTTTEGTVIAKVHLHYLDGTSTNINIKFGNHVRNWFGPWHKIPTGGMDSNTHEAWRALHSAAAATDDYLRLFHVTYDNPSPDKEVGALSLESTKKPAGLFIAGISVGPKNAERLPDTIPLSKNPFPDRRKRKGAPAQAEGIVKNKESQPIAGAKIFVTGARKITESYYDDDSRSKGVGMQATTGADGKFILPELPDNRLYRLLIAANGFKPAPFSGIDPKSDPVQIRLLPEETKLGKYVARARVVNLEGKPLSYALVEPDGVNYDGGTSWGNSSKFPEQLISNTNGEFVLSRDEPFNRVQVKISVLDLAPARTWIDVSNNVNTIEMGIGATIHGRVAKDGKPVAGIRVGVSGSERNSEIYAGHYETETDADGVFTISHLPPNFTWWFYGIVSSVKKHGAIKPVMVQSEDHGKSTDMGEIQVVPDLKLSGKVKTRFGDPLPKGTKVRVGFDNAWDSVVADVSETGEFSFNGLYKGQIDIYVEPNNWRLAAGNRSIDHWNSFQLVGILEKDKDDMLIVIEKGQRIYGSSSSGNGQLPSQDWPQNRPISGAEPFNGPPPTFLVGQIVDDATGKPISGVRITPGRKPPTASSTPPQKTVLQQMLQPLAKKNVPWNELPFWDYPHSESNSTGNFVLEFIPLSSTPMFKVEAKGYEPFESEPIAVTASNLVVRLKRGAGVGGIVLLPDGKPAEGAIVLYAVRHQQFGLNGTKINPYGNEDEDVVKTGKDGKFIFTPQSQGLSLFVSHPTGYTEESVERGGENLKLRLKPWAAISGTLVHSNGTPAAGVKLEVSMKYDWQRGDPIMHIQEKTITDAQGNFLFTNVPPRILQVQRIIPSGNGSWSTKLQTWLEVEPGITNKLGKVTYDTPPPPPMVDQIKQKLGL